MTPEQMVAELTRLAEEQARTTAAVYKLTRLLAAIAGEEIVQGDPDRVREGFLEFRQRVRANLARRSG